MKSLPGPLAELPADVQENIWGCVPRSEVTATGAISARGMVAMMEGVKRYAPPDIAAEADWAIREIIKASNHHAARTRGPRHQPKKRK